jgi:hypothetical protein
MLWAQHGLGLDFSTHQSYAQLKPTKKLQFISFHRQQEATIHFLKKKYVHVLRRQKKKPRISKPNIYSLRLTFSLITAGQ